MTIAPLAGSPEQGRPWLAGGRKARWKIPAGKPKDGLKNNKPGCIVVVNEMKTYANEPTRHIELRDYIATDSEILGGEPVFRGTRVPVVSLFEHLESDGPLDEFLENFPSVSREAAVAVIMGAQALILEKASR